MVARNIDGKQGALNNNSRTAHCRTTTDMEGFASSYGRAFRQRSSKSQSTCLFGISYEDIKGKSFETKMTPRQMASLVIALMCGSLFCIVFGA